MEKFRRVILNCFGLKTLKNNWGLKPFVYVDFIYWYWPYLKLKLKTIIRIYQLMTSPLNVSTNDVYLWKVTIYSKTTIKKVVRRVALFYMFSNLFTEWPNRSQMDSYICLSIQFVVILLWLKKVKKILPHRYVVEKGTSIFGILGNCGYSSLILKKY